MNRTWYCLGCNACFRQTSDDARCPQCGAEFAVRDDVPLAETLLIKAGAANIADDSAETDLDQLVGSDLHVYECRSLLGRGGMGHVYLAQHRDLNRRCALKILSPRLAKQDAEYVSRFLDEGRAAAALVHPNIVTTHAIGHSRGYHFLEMEYVAGRSLQRLIQDEGPLTAVRATALALKIAGGLALAHRAGIVHRDLKPDNVMMTPEGTPKITDFGLAKLVAGTEGAESSEIRLVGTPNFLAPELFQGTPASGASDVYALGVCYFFMLTGRPPFVGGTLESLMAQAGTQPVPDVRQENPLISLEMAECLNLMLAKSAANRPANATAAAQLLSAVLGQAQDIESLLREAFHDSPDVSWMRADSRYRLRVNMSQGRQQTVFVEPSQHGAAERLLVIFSICCPAQPEYYEEALKLNSEILHGGLSIRNIDGEANFVMMDTYPRATVDAEEIRKSVIEVARHADAVEKRLTDLDLN